MRYQKRNYSRRTTYRSGGIDWKRSLLSSALWLVAIWSLMWLIGFKGIFIAALPIIGYFLGPKLLRNIKLSHRNKQSRNRKKVNRYEILDLEE